MPTRDYDPINELIEAIHNNGICTWPTIKATTDTKGNVYISCDSTDEYVTAKPSGLTTYKPVKLDAKGSLPTVEEKPVSPFEIRSVLSNRKKNAFSVVWMDGTTTVVHCQAGDEWDDEKALAMCFTKKALGNKGNFNDKFNDALDNKMKTIPAKKKCDCEGTCKTCTCDINTTATVEIANDIPTKEEVHEIVQEAIAKVAKPAEKAARSMTNMINALTDTVEKKSGTVSRIEGPYKVFIKSSNAITPAGTHNALMPAGTYNTIKLAKERVIDLATQIMGSKPHYYRLWTDEGKLYIDFGSYSKYIVLDGVGTEDWYNV